MLARQNPCNVLTACWQTGSNGLFALPIGASDAAAEGSFFLDINQAQVVSYRSVGSLLADLDKSFFFFDEKGFFA
jgi:hypothetical protein